jgi:sulfur-oxidizing protein SoxY
VVLGVTVESPMTEIDHVRAIHVFAPLNPLPNMISVYLGPRAGRARFTTRVRVADSQTLVALAQLSDGSFWSDQVSVVVTLAACTEEVK